MKKYEDLKRTQEWCLKNSKYKSDSNAYELMDRLEVHSDMKTRAHTFSCGTEGEVVDEITIKIKIPRLDIQPHQDFEASVIDEFVSGFMTGEVARYLENAEY